MSVRQEDGEDLVSSFDADAEGPADDFALEVPRWNQWQSWGGGNGGTLPQWGRTDYSGPPEPLVEANGDALQHAHGNPSPSQGQQSLPALRLESWGRSTERAESCTTTRRAEVSGRCTTRRDSAERRCDKARHDESSSSTRQRSEKSSVPALQGVSCSKEPAQSEDAEAAADALRTLDLAGRPLTRSTNRHLAALTPVGESDEEAFANLDNLDLSEDEAFHVVNESRPDARATHGSTTHRSPLDDRRNLRSRTHVDDSDCQTESDFQVCRTLVSRVSQATPGQLPGAITLHTSRPEGQVVSNHSALAADEVTTFSLFPSARQGCGSGPDRAKCVHLSSMKIRCVWTEGGRTASHASARERRWAQVDLGRGIVAAVHRRSFRTHRGYADQRGHSTHFVGGLDVLGTVQTKVHSKVLLDRSSFGHRHVSIAGPGELSDFFCCSKGMKRYGVTAQDLSLRTSSQTSPSGVESDGKKTPQTKQQIRHVSHPRIEAQESQASQHLFDVSTAGSRVIDDLRQISHHVDPSGA